jgi:hypothetical protein
MAFRPDFQELFFSQWAVGSTPRKNNNVTEKVLLLEADWSDPRLLLVG